MSMGPQRVGHDCGTFTFTLLFPFSGKESSCQCRRCKRLGFDRWAERSPGVGNGSPLHYSCLDNAMDRRAGQAAVHGSQRVGHD